MKCEVEKCKSFGASAKSVLFYKFPRDPDMSKRWATSINKKNLTTKERFVCSLHFPAEAFIVSGNSICLTEDAVPTIITKNGNYDKCPYNTIVKKRLANRKKSINNYIHDETKRPSTSESSVGSEQIAPIRIRKDLTKVVPFVTESTPPGLQNDPLTLPTNDYVVRERKPTRRKHFRKHILKELELVDGRKARIVIRPKGYVLKPDGTYCETEVKTDAPHINSIKPVILDENSHPINYLSASDIARIEADLRMFKVEKKTPKTPDNSDGCMAEDDNDVYLDNLCFDPSDKMISINGKILSKLYDAYVRNKVLELKLQNLKARYDEREKKLRLVSRSLSRAKRRMELYKIPGCETDIEDIEVSE